MTVIWRVLTTTDAGNGTQGQGVPDRQYDTSAVPEFARGGSALRVQVACG